MDDDPSLISARLGGVSDVRALLEGLFFHAPVAFQVYRADGHSLVVNPAFRALFGSEPPAAYNVLKYELVAKTGALEIIRRAFAGETVQMPTQWYDAHDLKHVEVKESRRVAMRATFFPLFDCEKVVRHVGVAVRDVTSEQELKVASEEHRLKEERLRLALEAGRMITLDTELATGRVYVSDNAREVLGLLPDVPLETTGDWMALFHPDDRAKAVGDMALSPDSVPPLDRIFRIVLPHSGEIRWIERRGRLAPQVVGESGRWVRGIIMDVSERVRSEDALRVSEARYRTQFEAAPEAIVTLDVDAGVFVEVNENAIRLLGRSREELLRLNPAALSPPVQPNGRPSLDASLGYIDQAMRGERPVFDWVHRNAAGDDIPCEIRLVRLPGQGQNLCRGSIIDISARKRAESEHRRLEGALRATEDQLRQSQKLEAIGRLAGGGASPSRSCRIYGKFAAPPIGRRTSRTRCWRSAASRCSSLWCWI
jgi:PAS domain S-box-containing protein